MWWKLLFSLILFSFLTTYVVRALRTCTIDLFPRNPQPHKRFSLRFLITVFRDHKFVSTVQRSKRTATLRYLIILREWNALKSAHVCSISLQVRKRTTKHCSVHDIFSEQWASEINWFRVEEIKPYEYRGSDQDEPRAFYNLRSTTIMLNRVTNIVVHIGFSFWIIRFSA